MQRHTRPAREDWVHKVQDLGLIYHHTDHPDGSRRPYWDESIYYSFALDEILELEKQTKQIHELCLKAADHVVEHKRFAELGIPFEMFAAIETAWDADPPSVYGRFDLFYDGKGPAKLLEYNADTPTGLVESAVVQWQWLEEVMPGCDQWNSIHERLVEAWKRQAHLLHGNELWVAHSKMDDSGEDLMNAAYLRETAMQAGLVTYGIQMEDIGWNHDSGHFVDLEDRVMRNIFKLYPWEWMIDERFGPQVIASLVDTLWIEPVWKLLLSSKAMLAILWELFPDHPNLLPAYLDDPKELKYYAKKPFFGREGANVELMLPGGDSETRTGTYGDQRFVYQQLAPLPQFDGAHPVIGSWVIDHEPAGMGIRESDGLITDNLTRFVPHIIEKG